MDAPTDETVCPKSIRSSTSGTALHLPNDLELSCGRRRRPSAPIPGWARGSWVGIQQVLAKTYAGFRGEAVFPVERDWLEASCSIERQSGGLPDAGFEDKSPNAHCPRPRRA